MELCNGVKKDGGEDIVLVYYTIAHCVDIGYVPFWILHFSCNTSVPSNT